MPRGRRSTSALAIAAPLDAGNIEALARLKPPVGLSLGELRVWKATVAGKPPEWFGQEHGPILLGYCSSAAAAEEWGRLIRALDKDAADYPKKLEKYLALQKRELAMVNTLARAMRLTHQSAYRQRETNPKRGVGGPLRPWELADE